MKILTTRLQQKHDIAANWEKSMLIPLAGEIIVYDDRYINSDHQEVIVAATVRYKIGDGVTPVKDLPFADTLEIANKVKELTWRVDDLVSEGLGTLVPVDGTIQITSGDKGIKNIGVAIAPVAGNALTVVDGGLFVPIQAAQSYSAGTGLEIVDNKIAIKLATDTHGLLAVDGALTLSPATKNADGAMSKEDKAFLDAIPNVYDARKYELAYKPEGTIVDYREKEIRIMCPSNTVWTLQNSGANADPNAYYVGLKAYAPEGATCFKEDLAEGIADNTIYYFENNKFAGIDEYGRKYSLVWLPVAKLTDNAWTYYGKTSTDTKFVGWYYTVEWYSSEKELIDTETIRINLSNETCHNNINTFYGVDNDLRTEVAKLQETLADLREDVQDDNCWLNF